MPNPTTCGNFGRALLRTGVNPESRISRPSKHFPKGPASVPMDHHPYSEPTGHSGHSSPSHPASPTSPSFSSLPSLPSLPLADTTSTSLQHDAQTEGRLKTMQAAARAQARRLYATSHAKAGGGAGAAPSLSPVLRKRALKAESAFVSRYSSRLYCAMLERGVADAEAGLVRLRGRGRRLQEEASRLRWAIVQAENALLRREIERLNEVREARAGDDGGDAAPREGLRAAEVAGEMVGDGRVGGEMEGGFGDVVEELLQTWSAGSGECGPVMPGLPMAAAGAETGGAF